MKNKYEVRGEVTAIFIKSRKYGDKEALISTRHLERVMSAARTWYVRRGSTFYVRSNIYENGKSIGAIHLHRIVSDCPDGMEPDHINGDGLDNRDENLRIATRSENGQNKKMNKNNTSGYRGVTWHKTHKRWLAYIKVNGKKIELGTFKTAEEAGEVSKRERSIRFPFSKEARELHEQTI